VAGRDLLTTGSLSSGEVKTQKLYLAESAPENLQSPAQSPGTAYLQTVKFRR